jgi:hypothetical protein
VSQFYHETGRNWGREHLVQRGKAAMSRIQTGFITVVLSLALAQAALAAPVHKKHRVTRHWHGYGFLPGYRTPEQIQADRDAYYWASGPHYYGPAWPRFYRGRWNGGGFGPCYTQTPIGPMWNCGQ